MLKKSNADIAVMFLIVLTMITGALALTPQAKAQGEIAASVNNGIITQYQVTHRARFLRLTGFKGDAVEQAMKELVDEELQSQEAKRINFSLPDSAVDRAYGNIAKRFKISPQQFSQGLRQRGIDPNTLKQRLRAQITWQQIVRGRSRAESRPQQRTDITSILFNRGGDGQNRKVKEYTIERFVFVVKRDSSESAVRQRLREAEAFRGSYKSCEDAGERARALNDVVVTQLGRFTAETLPDDIKDEVLGTDVGEFTKPKRGELGIGLMAVCKTREIVDNTPTTQFDINKFSTEELQQKSEEWMQELKNVANVQVR